MSEETKQAVGAPTVANNARFDIFRNDIAIQLGIVAMLIDLAATYTHFGYDDLLDDAMKGARDRMRVALSLTAKLMRERSVTGINGEAAAEWRAQRGRGFAA